MILADTSVWIEFLRGNNQFEHLGGLLEQREITTTGAIFGELLQGARSAREINILKEYWNNLISLDDSSSFWFQAGLLSYHDHYLSKGIGLIDASIIAAARQYQCSIWTLDKKILSVLRKTEIFSS